jgi:uncharacterized C2H2 Zn-finger protein
MHVAARQDGRTREARQPFLRDVHPEGFPPPLPCRGQAHEVRHGRTRGEDTRPVLGLAQLEQLDQPACGQLFQVHRERRPLGRRGYLVEGRCQPIRGEGGRSHATQYVVEVARARARGGTGLRPLHEFRERCRRADALLRQRRGCGNHVGTGAHGRRLQAAEPVDRRVVRRTEHLVHFVRSLSGIGAHCAELPGAEPLRVGPSRSARISRRSQSRNATSAGSSRLRSGYTSQ